MAKKLIKHYCPACRKEYQCACSAEVIKDTQRIYGIPHKEQELLPCSKACAWQLYGIERWLRSRGMG